METKNKGGILMISGTILIAVMHMVSIYYMRTDNYVGDYAYFRAILDSRSLVLYCIGWILFVEGIILMWKGYFLFSKFLNLLKNE